MAQHYILCLVCYSVVFLGRETGFLQLLAPLLLTGGKVADLMICGDVVFNRSQHNEHSRTDMAGSQRRQICPLGPFLVSAEWTLALGTRVRISVVQISRVCFIFI